jgi:hypothetical protein
MHREYERAVTGSERRGRSPLAWLFAAVGIFLVLGVGGAMLATARARHGVERLQHVMERASRAAPETRSEVAATRLVEQLRSHEALLSVPPDEGIRFLRGLSSADPSEAFVKALVDARGERTSQVDVSSLSDGGSLEFGTDEGRVSLRLRRTDAGGTLSIESPDGSARIDLVRTDDGGFLTIDSDDGGVRFDLTRGEDGGRLEVRTDDGETLRLGFGESARRIPSWVPRMDGFPEPPRPVYSLDGTEGELGAVAWEGDTSIEEILSFYKDRLEADGYRMDAEHRRSDTDLDEGSLWARDESSGRMVFVAAHRRDGTTKVLLGYGERTP